MLQLPRIRWAVFVGILVGIAISLVGLVIVISNSALPPYPWYYGPFLMFSQKPGLHGCPTLTQVCMQMLLEEYDWRNLEVLNMTYRNVGAAPFFFAYVSLNGGSLTSQAWGQAKSAELSGTCAAFFDPINSLGLPTTQECSMLFTISPAWIAQFNITRGVGYAIEIRDFAGNTFEYSMIAGQNMTVYS